MWIRRSRLDEIDNRHHEERRLLGEKIDAAEFRASKAVVELSRTIGELERIKIENERLRSDMDWFKLRLNQVEKERAQLILSATGVKMSYPEFTPAYNPEDVFNNLPDLSSVGGDAKDEGESAPAESMGVDYSLLPGYKK